MLKAASISFAFVIKSEYLHFIPSSNNNPEVSASPVKFVALFNLQNYQSNEASMGRE